MPVEILYATAATMFTQIVSQIAGWQVTMASRCKSQCSLRNLWFVSGSVHHADVQRLRALEVHVGVAAEGGLHARVHVALLRTHHHACTQHHTVSIPGLPADTVPYWSCTKTAYSYMYQFDIHNHYLFVFN